MVDHDRMDVGDQAESPAKNAENGKPHKELKMAVNKCYIFMFLMVVDSPGFLQGYALGEANQVQPCFNEKFGWET